MTTRQKISDWCDRHDRELLMSATVFKLIVIFACIALLLFGCKTREYRRSQKAIAKMEKADAKYKAKSEVDTAAPHFCNTNYPPRVGKGSVRIIKGDTVTKTDTFTTVQHDTTTNVQTVTKTVVKWHYVHDTAHTTDTFQNTNAEKLLQAQVDGKNDEIEKLKNKLAAKDLEILAEVESKKGWRKTTLWTWGIIALIILGRVAWGAIRRYIAWKS